MKTNPAMALIPEAAISLVSIFFNIGMSLVAIWQNHKMFIYRQREMAVWMAYRRKPRTLSPPAKTYARPSRHLAGPDVARMEPDRVQTISSGTLSVDGKIDAQTVPAPRRGFHGEMQHFPPSASGRATPSKTARQTTNNDAPGFANSLKKRLSLHAAANTPLPQSPALNSPRHRSEGPRFPSSPSIRSGSLQRSSSVASLSRSSSPALGRKSSTSSLRGDMPGTPRVSGSRRQSFAPNMPSPMGPNSPLAPQPEEKLPLCASDVAEEYFKKEMALHQGIAGSVVAGTLVIVHDQCYGHRYARPKTHPENFAFIKERPERILATILGISAAYVLLGDRHAEGSNPPHPHRMPSEQVPFKIRKTSRVVDITSPVVTNVHGVKWMEELKTMCQKAEQKLATTGKELTREGSAMPRGARKEALHEGDLYLCVESLNAFQGALGGVLDAVDAVFQGTSIGSGPSRAFVCVRPPGHHCSTDLPSGFCWLNNVHVGIEHAIMQHGLTHAAIIDFDLHHGDGSQKIAWARNKKVWDNSENRHFANAKKTSIGYFSLHDINSFPCEAGDASNIQAASVCIEGAYGQSIWNTHLERWDQKDGVDTFWKAYKEKYVVILEKARKYLKDQTEFLRTTPGYPTPKAAIFVSAGFDANENETVEMQRHGARVPTDFYARFTRDIVRIAEEEDTGVEGRVISVLEGGYSDRALTSGVLSHLSGLTDGQVWSETRTRNGLTDSLRQGLSRLRVGEDVDMDPTDAGHEKMEYDPMWWHESRLVELDNVINPPPAFVARKPRTGPAPTYFSPTQSFSAKVVDPTKLHRSMSGKYMSASPSRAPTPPPPEVDWATAAHELSKLLIPTDRQTLSNKSEDLWEPKIKKEKAAPVVIPAFADPSGRQLRGRKPASYAEPDSDLDKSARAMSNARASRRRTIADPAALVQPAPPTRIVSRRMSMASSVGSVSSEMPPSRAASVVPGSRGVTPASDGTANTVQVKKTRGTTTAASRIPKNVPPVPRLPSGYQAKAPTIKEKENDMDALTSGIKRITLKLPSKEEYEARERQKALDAEKKAATKTTARKAPAPRTTKTTTKPPATKKAVGRPTKSVKPSSPLGGSDSPSVESPFLPQPPEIEKAATAALVQPQPLHVPSPTVGAEQRHRDLIVPPTELEEMTITAEQLPKPSFMDTTEQFTTSPPRPDTPPPPPPASIPTFVNYTASTYGTTTGQAVKQPQAPLLWQPTNGDVGLTKSANTARPLSAASKRQDLPIFSANGAIPFASNPNGAVTNGTATVKKEGEEHPPNMSENGSASRGLHSLNPFSRHDDRSREALLFYKITTFVSWLLLLVTSFYYTFHAPHEGKYARHRFWKQNSLHPTPFSQNALFTSLYWLALFGFQGAYQYYLYASESTAVAAAANVGSHFIANNLLLFGFVNLWVRSHFFLAEFLLVINFINLSAAYFRHPVTPRIIHIGAVSGPLAWNFVALYWVGAVVVHSNNLAGRIVANIFIWSFLAYGTFFLAAYKDYTIGFALSILAFSTGVGQFFTHVIAFQWIFAFTIGAVLFVLSLAVGVPGLLGRDPFKRGAIVDEDRERAPLLADENI
ncbi:hypothetical protein P154DRAFT_564472 [Amniculicola lignicola CBS 123094]|uniref:Histone deacetylase domain-containing protein n=1 Tax=Amniculicola lignicola CBS 123094 TaxID=1392246 RepID=A0A6A5WBA5_9PLEO|nr:hypothetical protein P154DRAFT_564472 [Amniculicola lignicola CBS 123094]